MPVVIMNSRGHNGLYCDPEVAEKLRKFRMDILALCDGKPTPGTFLLLLLLTPRPPKPIPPNSSKDQVVYWVFPTGRPSRRQREVADHLRPGFKKV
ncbi:hypothetical protein ACSS6W_000427 [Trichoderma asperelloides]|uniref:Uncharacterized protein n=1 Tax=Trichoderma asperellum TaxID=101201 RepID=A0A6V8QKH4_TRIAP|nr:hypothetical protein LI328DRAFT_142514 [Trichoderma asperelloides]GFP52994.1 hypothetical protein TASIC1_0002017800 [Trichoderma asperellum]